MNPFLPHKGEFWGRKGKSSLYFTVEVLTEVYESDVLGYPRNCVTVLVKSPCPCGNIYEWFPDRAAHKCVMVEGHVQTVSLAWFYNLGLEQLSSEEVIERRDWQMYAKIYGLPPIHYSRPVIIP
jgi:hypothetical protein